MVAPEAPARPTIGGELPIVRLRHWGRWVSAVIILALLAGLGVLLARAQIEYDTVPAFLWYHVMLVGLLNTVVLAGLAQAVAIVIGVVVALLRMSANPVARVVAAVYVWLFRGLPVLLQILLWFNLALVFQYISIPLPFGGYLVHEQTNVLISAFVAALLGLALNETAYMAEIVRAGLTSVDRGQIEAAKSIGMTPAMTLRRVVLPQAMRETLLAAAIGYMVVVTVASIGQHYLERAFGASDRAGTSPWSRVGRALRAMPLRRA